MQKDEQPPYHAAPGPERAHRTGRGRRRALAVVVGALALVAVSVSIASGQGGGSSATIAPGSYSGAVANYGELKYVTLKVDQDGTWTSTLRCNEAVPAVISGARIVNGTFHGSALNAQGQTLWTVSGSSHDSDGDALGHAISINLVLPRACDSIGGTGFLGAS